MWEKPKEKMVGVKGKYVVIFLATCSNPYPESDEKHKIWNEGYQACDSDWRKAAGKILGKLVKEGLKEVKDVG